MDLNSLLARELAEKWRRCCGSDDLCQRLERDIREAIDKTQQQERLRLADEAEKSSYLRLVLADVPKHVALWLRGQA